MTTSYATSFVYAKFLGHEDYNSGSTKVTSYSLPRPAGSTTDDWMYLVHLNVRDTSGDIDPVLPGGWQNVVPSERIGTPAAGIEWSIWRKKLGADLGVTVSYGSGSYFTRATLIGIRQPSDSMPVISPYVTPRSALNPSVITVPGAQLDTTALSFAFQHQPNAVPFTQPPRVDGPSTHLFTSPSGGNNMFIAVAEGVTPVANTSAVVFSWPQGDAGQVSGVTLSFIRLRTDYVGPPPILYPWPPNSNLFFCDTDQYHDGVITLFGGTLTPGTATVYRIDSDSSYFVVRGGQAFRVTGDFVLSDTEAPFDVSRATSWITPLMYVRCTTTGLGTRRSRMVPPLGIPDLPGRSVSGRILYPR